MKTFKTRLGTFVLVTLGGVLAATAASATGVQPGPSIPEPTSALLFAAGMAVTAITVRMVRRK